MYKHHQDTVDNLVHQFKAREDISALIVGGSIAHGFAKETSDVDIMLLISDEEYEKRRKTGDMHYFDTSAVTYEGGYIDGKYICPGFLKKVAKLGNEPTRFAFKDVLTIYSKIEGLDKLFKSVTRYPKEKKSENIKKFYAQFEAWHWYCYEAIKHKNKYLLNHSVSNLVLYGGRMLLAYNEVLYPYHKWFMRVLDSVNNKPEGIVNTIENVLVMQSGETVEEFYKYVRDFTNWGIENVKWPSQFMLDTELTWMDDKVYVSDI